MPTTDFTTVARVKRYQTAQTGTVSDQALIQEVIEGASQAFRSVLNRDLFAETYEEIRDGTGTGTMLFANYPVTAVPTVEVGALPGTRRALVENVDFVWSRTAVKLLGGQVFPRGPATVRLAYSAGFAELPADIVDACTKVVGLRLRQLQRLGQMSKSMGNETVTFDLADFPKDVQTVLNNYAKRIQV
jgi:hypothetical protein